MSNVLSKESVFKKLENVEKGLTFDNLRHVFFGSKELTPEEDDQLFGFLLAVLEDDDAFLEYSIFRSTCTFYSKNFRCKNGMVK